MAAMDRELYTLARTIDPGLLGRRLRTIRTTAGLRQADVAESVCSVPYLSRIEKGQRRPEPELLEQIARALDVSLERLLHGHSARDETDAELRLALDYAELYLASGEPEEALRRANEVVARSAREDLDLDLSRSAQRVVAAAQEALGRTGEAIRALDALLEDSPDDLTLLQTMVALCRCHREAGDLTAAIAVGKAATQRAEELGLGGSTEAVQVMVTMAAAHYESGDLDRAIAICEDAIARAEIADSPVGRASAYWNASVIESHRGDVTAAIAMAEKALALFEVAGEARPLARLRSQLGIYLLRLEPPEVEAAQDILRRARVEMAGANATAADLARNDLALAHALFLSGDRAAAASSATDVYEATREEYPLLAAEARMLSGSALAGEGNAAEARAAAREAVLMLTSVGADAAVGQLWFDLAELLDRVGEPVEAREAYRRSAVSAGMWRRLGTAAPRPMSAQQHQ